MTDSLLVQYLYYYFYFFLLVDILEQFYRNLVFKMLLICFVLTLFSITKSFQFNINPSQSKTPINIALKNAGVSYCSSSKNVFCNRNFNLEINHFNAKGNWLWKYFLLSKLFYCLLVEKKTSLWSTSNSVPSHIWQKKCLWGRQ